jgi:general stress protein 26
MRKQQLKKTGLELMAKAEMAYFTTVDNKGFPQTRVMANFRNKRQFPDLVEFFEQHKENYLIYLATNARWHKIRQIKANPKASVYYCQPDENLGMMVAGKAEIVRDKELKNKLWQKGWEVYYPGGPQGRVFTIIRLTPAFVKGWLKKPFEFELKRTL